MRSQINPNIKTLVYTVNNIVQIMPFDTNPTIYMLIISTARHDLRSLHASLGATYVIRWKLCYLWRGSGAEVFTGPLSSDRNDTAEVTFNHRWSKYHREIVTVYI